MYLQYSRTGFSFASPSGQYAFFICARPLPLSSTKIAVSGLDFGHLHRDSHARQHPSRPSAARSTHEHVVADDDRLREPSVGASSRANTLTFRWSMRAGRRRFQVEDVRGLHARVQDLAGLQGVVLRATHDLRRPQDALQRRSRRDFHDELPVLIILDKSLAQTNLTCWQVHAARFPDLDEVLPRRLDLLEVAAELVVRPRVPVRDEHGEVRAGLRHPVHVDCAQHGLRDMDFPEGSKPSYATNECFSLRSS